MMTYSAIKKRYGEYRYKPSLVTGRFRSNATTSLETWHYAQGLLCLTCPRDNLGSNKAKQTYKETLAVASEPQFIF